MLRGLEKLKTLKTVPTPHGDQKSALRTRLMNTVASVVKDGLLEPGVSGRVANYFTTYFAPGPNWGSSYGPFSEPARLKRAFTAVIAAESNPQVIRDVTELVVSKIEDLENVNYSSGLVRAYFEREIAGIGERRFDELSAGGDWQKIWK